jgi:hypothetical protein
MPTDNNNEYVVVSKYDRIRGGLDGVALFTKPSTIKNVQNITGKSETFVVETCRHDELGGDFVFIEMMDETGVVRLALPPRVANAIASQRDSLTVRRRIQARRQGAEGSRRVAGVHEEEESVRSKPAVGGSVVAA